MDSVKRLYGEGTDEELSWWGHEDHMDVQYSEKITFREGSFYADFSSYSGL